MNPTAALPSLSLPRNSLFAVDCSKPALFAWVRLAGMVVAD